jgi:hypothetical protein
MSDISRRAFIQAAFTAGVVVPCAVIGSRRGRELRAKAAVRIHCEEMADEGDKA